nr:MAG TPA: hypothetical protein [Caudoviricetes sp.]
MTIEWGENAKGGRVEITITAFNKVLDVCSVVG